MLEWPFSRRSFRTGLRAPEPRDLPKREEFEHNDCRLKLWLPQQIVDRLNWLAEGSDLSRADLIRALVFKHLYGEVAYEKLMSPGGRVVVHDVDPRANSEVPAFFPQPISADAYARADAPTIVRSPARNSDVDMTFIGSSSNNLPIEVPRRMRDDLRKLAKIEGLTISSCVRKLLVLKLLGAELHASWQRAIGPLSPAVISDDLENEAP